MIIQGSNNPIQIEFDDISDITAYSIVLIAPRPLPVTHYDVVPDPAILKHWSEQDLEFDGNTVYAPLTESETISFPAGVASIEIKWIDDESNIWHTRVYRERIAKRYDDTTFGATPNLAIVDNAIVDEAVI